MSVLLMSKTAGLPCAWRVLRQHSLSWDIAPVVLRLLQTLFCGIWGQHKFIYFSLGKLHAEY